MIGKGIGPFPEELVEKIRDTQEDYDFVEIPIGEAEIDPEEIEIEKLKSVLDEKDFELVVHLPFRQPICTSVEIFNKSVKNYFEDLLKFSNKLGAFKAVVHTDVRHKFDIEENQEKLEKQLEDISQIGKEHDIEICFENVDIGYLNGTELFKLGEILREKNLSMCFDTGHAFYETNQEELEEFIEEFSDIISHYHIQDTRENKDLHLPIGVGEIDFNFLEDISTGTFCLEIFTDDTEYLEISRKRISELIEN